MSGPSIDEWLPVYQVSARYSISVGASVERTYSALTSANFADLKLVRSLMRLRGYGGGRSHSTPQPEGRRFGSFLELAIVPQKEVLVGIAGRFWRPDGGIVRGVTPDLFRSFQRPGYAKAVWSFSLAPADGGTELNTETRIQTFGPWASTVFRLYWTVVGPFSGLIRKSMLGEVRRIAETSETATPSKLARNE